MIKRIKTNRVKATKKLTKEHHTVIGAFKKKRTRMK